MAEYKVYLDYIHHVDDQTQSEILDKENAIRDSYENQLAELKENYKTEIDNLKKEYDSSAADVNKKINEFVAKVKKERETERISAENEKNSLIKKYEKEIADLRNQHAKSNADAENVMKSFVAKNNKEREAERISAENEKNNLIKKYLSEISDLKETISAKEQELKNFDDSITKAEYESIKEQYEKENAELKTKVTYIKVGDKTMLGDKQTEAVLTSYIDAYNKQKKIYEARLKAKDEVIYDMKNRSFFEKLKDLFKK